MEEREMEERRKCDNCNYFFKKSDLMSKTLEETLYSDQENESHYTDIEHIPQRSETRKSSIYEYTYRCPKCGTDSYFSNIE
jgi:DNA-directed RNA polymerase subunit M/transcription elongation factor TFIIS